MSATESEPQEPAEEMLTVAGEANNVLTANAEAWAALEAVLSYDPVKAWRLDEINHTYHPADENHPGPWVSFVASFERDPEVPTPRSQEEADYFASEDQEVEA